MYADLFVIVSGGDRDVLSTHSTQEEAIAAALDYSNDTDVDVIRIRHGVRRDSPPTPIAKTIMQIRDGKALLMPKHRQGGTLRL